MRLSFFIREAFRALRRNAAPSVAAALTVLVTALMLGVFIPVFQATSGKASEVRDRVLVEVYAVPDVSKQQLDRLKGALEATSDVASVELVPAEQAYAEQRTKDPEAYSVAGRYAKDAFPDLFRITPENPDLASDLVARLQPDNKGKANPAFAIIDEAVNREEETKKILSFTGIVRWASIGLGVLLMFASIALVANTIRLSVFARRREVEVMRLVGATNWFIRWPFVIEGVIVGLAGGALAVALLALAKVTVIDSLEESFNLLSTAETIAFPLLGILLVLACIVVSALGSAFTLRRYLRI